MMLLISVFLTHQKSDLQHDESHDCDAHVRREYHKCQLEGFLCPFSNETNLVVVKVKNGVVVSEEGVANDPKVLLAQWNCVYEAVIILSRRVVMARNFVGVCVRERDFQWWELIAFLVLTIRAFTLVATIPIDGTFEIMHCLEHIDHAF